MTLKINIPGYYPRSVMGRNEGGRRYDDITGEVQLSQFADVDAVYEEDIEEIEKWSFGYNTWLYKLCPESGAEVIA